MEVLNKIMPLILTAIMSVNLSGCGNSSGANGSQPAETSAVTAQYVDEERPFELTNSIIIDGHEYSLPTDLEALSESVIVNKDAKEGTHISYKYEGNIIGDAFIADGKVVSLTFDFDSKGDMPDIFISNVRLSQDLDYDTFLHMVKDKNPEIREEVNGIRLKKDNLLFWVLFNKDGSIYSACLNYKNQEE